MVVVVGVVGVGAESVNSLKQSVEIPVERVERVSSSLVVLVLVLVVLVLVLVLVRVGKMGEGGKVGLSMGREEASWCLGEMGGEGEEEKKEEVGEGGLHEERRFLGNIEREGERGEEPEAEDNLFRG